MDRTRQITLHKRGYGHGARGAVSAGPYSRREMQAMPGQNDQAITYVNARLQTIPEANRGFLSGGHFLTPPQRDVSDDIFDAG